MELLTVDELAELLRVSRSRLILMARRGEIPAVQVSGKLLFDMNEVTEWLKRNRPAQNDEAKK